MASFTPDDILQRVPDLALRIDAANTVAVQVGGGHVQLGYGALELLAALHHPTTVTELLHASTVSSAQAWIDQSAALVQLVALGAVTVNGIAAPGATAGAEAHGSSYGFDAHYTHIRMLDDVQRTTAFRSAVLATVRPGDVVVDIGTGTGVLAIAAAQAGAAHVYAVEAGAVADLAEAVIADNGFADRITVVRGWSTEIALPRRADVVVSETIGSEPLEERILEIMADARDRHAVPGARFVPERLQIFATPFELPDSTRVTFSPAEVARWSEEYGTRFGALLRWRGQVRQNRFTRKEVRGWRALAEPVLLADLDLVSREGLQVDEARTVRVELPGRLGGVYLHFDARLTPDQVLSTHPALYEDSSWLHAAELLPERDVVPGDELDVRYGYRAGTADGLRVVPNIVEPVDGDALRS